MTPDNPDRTVKEAIMDAQGLWFDEYPNSKSSLICEALGLDPAGSVARLREDLRLARRVRLFTNARPSIIDGYTSSGALDFIFGADALDTFEDDDAGRAVLGETDQP